MPAKLTPRERLEVRAARALSALPPRADDPAMRLLLAHDPTFWDLEARAAGFDLMLAGHTHGGQIRAPFDVGLYSISAFGERFQRGFIESDPRADGTVARGFVSRGLGTTGPPFRTFCPAEVIVLELEPAQ